MSNDCIIRLTYKDEEVYLYSEVKGSLARSGAKVAQCAREIQERQLVIREGQPVPQMSDFLTVASGLPFEPISIEGADLGQIERHYHIWVTDDYNVGIGYRKRGNDFQRINLPNFIRKVNKARRKANYPYKMLRQPLSPQPEPNPEPEPTGYTQEERLEIANTILQQMGGNGRLTAMIGMHNPMAKGLGELPGLKFHFRGSRKANICQVTYNPGSDTYCFELFRYTPVRYADCPCVFSAYDVYADMLKDLFERATGLYLTL